MDEMENWLSQQFSHDDSFVTFRFDSPDGPALAAKVMRSKEWVEFFVVEKPLMQQFGFRHMIAEWQILNIFDQEFSNDIRELKRTGIKTEPAFAQRLGLIGDPYIAILEYAAGMAA